MAASRKARKAVSRKPHADIEALGRQLGEDLGKATTPEAISDWLDDLNNSINCVGDVREALARGMSAAHMDSAYATVKADMLKYRAEREANKPTITAPSEEFDELEKILVDCQEFFEEARDDDREAQTLRAASAHLFGEVSRALCKLDDLRAPADAQEVAR